MRGSSSADRRTSRSGYTTDHDYVVDQSNALARLCRGDCTLLARWATAYYDKIIIRNAHFVGPPIHNASSIGFFLCQIQRYNHSPLCFSLAEPAEVGVFRWQPKLCPRIRELT
jgi:hypothetical protein